MRSGARIAGASVVALAAVGGSFAAGTFAGRSGPVEEARRERRRADAAEADSARLQRERDSLKAERDRLEQQLASTNESRACPDEFVSTATSALLAFYVADYPCGWHVLEEPLQQPPAGERDGLTVDNLFVDPLPISKAPREGPLAAIEVGVWSDDPNRDPDALPTLAAWIDREKKRYSKPPQERSLTTPAGARVTALSGTTEPFGDPVTLLLYLWEVTDTNGSRRIVQVSSLGPSASVVRALDRFVHTFRSKGA